jgi:hypothetical protein
MATSPMSHPDTLRRLVRGSHSAGLSMQHRTLFREAL